MDVDEVDDVTKLVPELLQIQELPPSVLRRSPQIAEDLFDQWLSLSETSRLEWVVVFKTSVPLRHWKMRSSYLALKWPLRSSYQSLRGIRFWCLQYDLFFFMFLDFPHYFSPIVANICNFCYLEVIAALMRVQVKSLIDGAKEGAPINAVENSSNLNAAGSSSLPSMFPSVNAPPLSPRSSSSSAHISKQRTIPSSHISPSKLVREPVQEVIPQFYFQNGPPPPKELKEQCLSRIYHHFNNPLGGLQIDEFKPVTKEVCRLPSFFSSTLFRKVDIGSTGIVTRDAFIRFWLDGNMLTRDTATQIYEILKHPDREYLTKGDFRPIIQELLATHPGLDFLKDTPEFQERYAETVTYTIFHYINTSGNGLLTLRELKRGNLIAAMQHVDEEEDINRVLRYFSYEQFYVIYIKFWELDTDRDSLIDKGDLIGNPSNGLNYKILERVFSQVPRKFTSEVEGKMNYEDFVHFLLAEEDKSSETSVEYWFNCIDLDGNGVLTPSEMKYFYDEQLFRRKGLNLQPVDFEVILSQIIDIIAPERGDYITLRDMKRCKLSGYVFDTLFNLKKAIAYEDRGPGDIRQELEEPYLTEWDRFVRGEYRRLAGLDDVDEDVPNDAGGGSAGGAPSEAPF